MYSQLLVAKINASGNGSTTDKSLDRKPLDTCIGNSNCWSANATLNLKPKRHEQYKPDIEMYHIQKMCDWTNGADSICFHRYIIVIFHLAQKNNQNMLTPSNFIDNIDHHVWNAFSKMCLRGHIQPHNTLFTTILNRDTVTEGYIIRLLKVVSLKICFDRIFEKTTSFVKNMYFLWCFMLLFSCY
jgi:hypothetical protein